MTTYRWVGSTSEARFKPRRCFCLATADQILEELADESTIDLRSHWPILPLIDIALYHIPPQPKKVQEWTIAEGAHRIESLATSHLFHV